MYTSFYHLKTKPFQIASDPTFIWLGEKHKEALATLTYGVLDNKGFMLLTGDVGTGKTTLINTLIKGLSDDILYASVPDPRLELNDFLNYIAHAFNIRETFRSKGQFLIRFNKFLLQAYEDKKKVLLLIDEAQLLTQDMLEEIRLLSNIQKDGLNLLNIFFVGQDEFNEILERPENRAVAQRLTLNYHLRPLSDQETESYIRHRLKIAGTTKQLFDEEAFMEIHRFSGGFPRRINILCDHCLLTGFVREQRVIGADTVRKCAEELKIPHYAGRRQAPRRPIPPRFESPAPAATPPSSVPSTAPSTAPSATPSAAPPAAPISPPRPQPPVPEPSAPPGRQAGPRQSAHWHPAPQRPARTKWPLLAFLVISSVALGLFYYYDDASFDRFYQEISLRLAILQNRPESGGPPAVPERQPESNPPPEQPRPEAGPDGATDAPDIPVAAPDTESGGDLQTNPSPPTPAGNDAVSGQSPAPAPSSAAVPEPADPPVVNAPVTEGASAAETTEPAAQSTEPAAAASAIVDAKVGNEAEPAGTESPFKQAADESLPRSDQLAQPEVPPPEPEAAVQSGELPQKTITVRFRSDSSELYFSDFERVDEFVAAVKQHPDVVLVISGHTDSLGSEGYNYRLSLFRANVVKSFFLGKGISSDQLRVRAFGSERPLVPNDTKEGRSINRRVEIDILQ